MNTQKNSELAVKTPRTSLRQLAVKAGYILGGLALIPLVLTIFYAFVAPPVSTLMVWRWAAGTSIDYRWRKMEQITPILPATILMTEDAQFCSHNGVDWGAVRAAFKSAEAGNRARGASTISMQTVKNVFLWPSRSYVRKVLEVPLAYFADLVWGKRRMMEIYLNIAEWGPGIYGAEAAAQYHFNRPASELTAVQAARLAAILPNPLNRSARTPSGGTRRLSRRAYARGRNSAPWTACIQNK